MTECERIIKQGILPESFFKEEVRNDFLVTTERKKIWAIEIDLLMEFDRICKKYNLKYWLAYGSLIGGVRHRGFIPWDDDMDVMMPRKDYDILVGLSNEFSHPYFLQTHNTDGGYYYSFAKIRNSNTTAISNMFAYETWNQGIFIDIFPNDNCNINDAKRIYDRIKYLNIENSTYMRISNPHLDYENKRRVEQYSGLDPYKSCEEIHQLAKKYNDCESDYCYNIVCTMTSLEKRIHKTAWYKAVNYCVFEGFLLPIPNGYDEILRKIYGNYMQYPPIQDRNGHYGALFDADESYRLVNKRRMEKK